MLSYFSVNLKESMNLIRLYALIKIETKILHVNHCLYGGRSVVHSYVATFRITCTPNKFTGFLQMVAGENQNLQCGLSEDNTCKPYSKNSIKIVTYKPI